MTPKSATREPPTAAPPKTEREQLVERLQEKLRKINGAALLTYPPEFSERAVKAHHICKSVNGFGCHHKSAVRLVEAFLGETLPKGDRGVGVANFTLREPGRILVPVNNPNGHDYPEGEPVLLLGYRSGLRPADWSQGNTLPVEAYYYRDPVPSDVEAVVERIPRMPEAWLQKLDQLLPNP